MRVVWNPWHGCKKISEGCMHCYVYRRDMSCGKDASTVTKNTDFNLPLRKNRSGDYKIHAGDSVDLCFTSDFFLEEADVWREDAWKMIRERSDLEFFFITKRIHRYRDCLPHDWGERGYENVTIGCTVENMKRVEERLPVFLDVPSHRKIVVCEPLLEDLDISRYLNGGKVDAVSVGGESGMDARMCDYEWVLNIRRQCVEAQVKFSYHQTGTLLSKDGCLYNIPRHLQHSQARRAGIDFSPVKVCRG